MGRKRTVSFLFTSSDKLYIFISESVSCLLKSYAVMMALPETRRSRAESHPRQHQRFPPAWSRSIHNTGLLPSNRCWCHKVEMSAAVKAAGRVGQSYCMFICARSCLIRDFAPLSSMLGRREAGSGASVSRVHLVFKAGTFFIQSKICEIGVSRCNGTAVVCPVSMHIILTLW